jgi:hypothetical protein
MNINLDEVKSVKLPTEPSAVAIVTAIMKDGSQQVLEGAEAIQFLTDWNKYQPNERK